MASSGHGIYFDGLTSARHVVSVYLEVAALRIMGEHDMVFERWPYGELVHLSAPDGVLRLGRTGSARLERLEIRDIDLAHAIDERSAPIDRSGATEHRSRKKIVALSMAAVVSLVLVGIYGVPALADRIAPFVPLGVERWLGEAVDQQVRSMLDTGPAGRVFECGSASGEQAGRGALDALVSRLESSAGISIPLHVVVVRRKEANAIALPGGHVYVFQGLIDKAENPHEVAGVIAHEIGHVASRDGTRAVLQTAGLSFLFGMLLGDFVGGGAVVIAAKTILNASYTREAEAAADRYGVHLMNTIGGDARALGAFLLRVAGATHPGVTILLDHPDTKERVAAINEAASNSPAKPLLSAEEWSALKRICAGN